MKAYSKTIAALAGLIAVVGQAVADGSVTSAEWGLIATAAATVVAVYQVRNASDEVV
jgi:hypothetical protein